MLGEIKLALRRLAKSPGFTVIAVLTVALAIGATTAVLSLVNGLLVRPLPYREPQQLILLLQHFKSQNLERIPVSPPEFKDYETRAHSFEKLGAFGYTSFNLAGEDRPERIAGRDCHCRRDAVARRFTYQGPILPAGRMHNWPG